MVQFEIALLYADDTLLYVSKLFITYFIVASRRLLGGGGWMRSGG